MLFDIQGGLLRWNDLVIIFMLIPMLHNYKRADHNRILTEIANIIEAGKLKPIVDENKYGLSDVADAYARLLSGEGMGKVVIEY